MWSLGCGTAGVPRGAEAANGAGAFPGGPPAPAAGLALPSLDVAWSPAQASVGDLLELERALVGRTTLVLVGPVQSQRDELAALTHALASTANRTWLAPQTSTQFEAFGGAVLPNVRRDDDGTFALDGVTAEPTWLAQMPADADAVVVVDVLDGAAALPMQALGGCDAVTSALAAGQEHGLADVEPFVAHLDALLLQVYRPAVAAMTPRWLEELAPYVDGAADDAAAGSTAAQRHACGSASLAYVRAVAACARKRDRDCTAAPRTFLQGGLRIGLPTPDGVQMPQGCATLVGRDYVAEAQRLAAEAVQVVHGNLDPRWLQLADRVGALTEVYAAVDNVCAPQRRRVSGDDLDVARERLARIGDALSSDLTASRGGRFDTATPASFFVPGMGDVASVARYDGGPASVATRAVLEARGLAGWLQTRARCRGDAHTPPWSVTVLDRTSGAALGLTYVFPEQLACDAVDSVE